MKPQLLLCLILVSCARPHVPPVFSGTPSYPVTEISLGGERILTHFARKQAGEAPPRNEEESKVSEWRLCEGDERILLRAPSTLTDPSGAGEFEDYYRDYDHVEVHQSGSGHTLVVVEDRSPHYPNRDYFLLRRGRGGAWEYRKLPIESYLRPDCKGPGSPNFQGALEYIFPDILEVSDTYIRHAGRKGPVQLSLP